MKVFQYIMVSSVLTLLCGNIHQAFDSNVTLYDKKISPTKVKLLGESFYLVLPDNFDITKTYKLAIGLHGYKGNGSDFAVTFASETTSKQIILVTLNGNSKIKKGYMWNDYEYNSERVMLVYNYLKDIYNIATEVLIFGFSQGANQTLYTSAVYPGHFTHYAGLSGGYIPIQEDLYPNLRRVSILFVYGDGDEVEQALDEGMNETIDILNSYDIHDIERIIIPGLKHKVIEKEVKILVNWFISSSSDSENKE
ncbi:MAG: hypothetical protein OEZ36_07575 [Spirochaetota bacterium]|nr:hypothetical protein [Spirochaetota bacterium]